LFVWQFANPDSLKPLRASLYVATEQTGASTECKPNQNGAGLILQGYLERSNVDLKKEDARLRVLKEWRQTLVKE
jgi:flagellar basal-body rod protein FlgG